MGKEDVVCIHNAILLSCKKEWNYAICSDMDGSRGYHIMYSKSVREREMAYDVTVYEI